MIIKNEERNILNTLMSCKEHIERYVILDTGTHYYSSYTKPTSLTHIYIVLHTGSSDSSISKIQHFFSSSLSPCQSGFIYQEPFVDFATSKNRVLYLAGQHTPFLLLLNGDDMLVKGEFLRVFLKERIIYTADDESMYIVPVVFNNTNTVGRSERIIRSRNHAVQSWPNDDWKHWKFHGNICMHAELYTHTHTPFTHTHAHAAFPE